MRRSVVVSLALALAGASATIQCAGRATQACGPETCPDGCCAADDICRADTSASACGAGGATCQDCQVQGGSCAGGTCSGKSGCSAQTCPDGCCSGDGICRNGTSASACGAAGAQCQDCQAQGKGCVAQQCSGSSDGGCTPNCTGRSCGTNGCGGSCGSCASGFCSVAGQCIQPDGGGCIPNCAGRICGTNGCAGSCGSCPATAYCTIDGTQCVGPDGGVVDGGAGDDAGQVGVRCGPSPCMSPTVCCFTAPTRSCNIGCPDGGPPILCDGPEDCTPSAGICCGTLRRGAGSCPVEAFYSSCASSCTVNVPAGCPSTSTLRLCHGPADCAGEPSGYTECCEFGTGSGSVTFCVNSFIKPSAVRCF